MTTIDLAAWGSADVRGLSETQARALATTGAVTVTPGWSPDSWTVAAGPFVGVICAEDVELRIRPRITVSRLIFLMGYAQDPRAWRDDPVGLDDQAELWPAMAQVFVRQSEKALELGLLQGYRTEETSQLVMRGRLRESDQLRRRAGLALPLELRYDEYDVDIAENRILRAATERLLRVPRLPRPSSRRLRHLLSRLSDARRVVPGLPLPATPTTRLNARYQPALALARMVLHCRSVDVLDAGVRATGFLVNMNTVFEDFVTVALTEALAPFGGHCVAQDTRHQLDMSGRVRLRPDLVHYGSSGQPQGVVDAKYKAESPAGYPYADLYQMLAYCTALKLPIGHLVYAEGGQARDIAVRHTEITIVQHAVDLGGSVAWLLDRMAELARELACTASVESVRI